MPQKILMPIDLARCPLELFEWVNRLGQKSPVTVILLHVVALNVMGVENRVYEELGRSAYSGLKQLAGKHLRPSIAPLLRVRFGKPAEEILVQARADHADLILLPVQHLGFQKRLVLPWRQSVGCHYHLAANDTGAGTRYAPGLISPVSSFPAWPGKSSATPPATCWSCRFNKILILSFLFFITRAAPSGGTLDPGPYPLAVRASLGLLV